MSVDPQMMAYLLQLQGSDAPPPQPGAAPEMGQHGIGQVPVGVAKGLGKNALAFAGSAGDIWDLAYHPEEGEQNPMVQGVTNMVTRPYDTIADNVNDIYEGLSGSPESFAETMSSFAMPHDFLPGKAPREPVTSNIWGGPKSVLYDWEAARKAKELKAAGLDDDEIYAATRDPRTRVAGYWNPPEQWGQQEPWMWIMDHPDAKLQPGAMDLMNDEVRRQFAQRIDAANRAQTISQGMPGAPPPDQFTRLRAQLLSSDNPGEMSANEKAFMSAMYPGTGLGGHEPLTLGDLMNPDWAAFEHYPGLRDYPVRLNPWAPYQGGHSVKGGFVTIGTGEEPYFSNKGGNMLDTLMHEPSHAVQEFEGMPAGGAPQQFTIYRSLIRKALADENLSPEDQSILTHASYNVGDAPYNFRTKYSGMDPDMRSYNQVTGEMNARLPNQVLARQRELARAGAEPEAVPPFFRFGDTGVIEPTRSTVIAPGGKLYMPGASPALNQYGITGEMRPRADLRRDLSQPASGPRDQLALALRRASQKKKP